MAEFLSRRMTFGGKVETTEGTAIAVAAADCNALAYDVQYTPNISMFSRKPVAQDLSPYSAIPGARSGRLTCKMELKGSGAAGTAPAIGKFLRACGFGETVNVGTSVVYQRALNQPTLSLAAYDIPPTGNNLKKLLRGVRGTFKLSPKVGEPGMVEFDFLGVEDGITDAAGITPTGLETTKPPAFLSTSFTMQAFAHKISQFSIDAGNDLTLREDITKAEGYFSCLIVDTEATFSMDPEKELVATHDYHGIWKAATEASMSVAFGATAGNICTITAPKSQYTDIKPGNRNGLEIFNVTGKFNRNAGNDELVFTFT